MADKVRATLIILAVGVLIVAGVFAFNMISAPGSPAQQMPSYGEVQGKPAAATAQMISYILPRSEVPK